MFKVHTVSGTVYTFDPDKKQVLRESSIPLHMTGGLREDTITGNWREYESFDIRESFVSLGNDHLFVFYPDGTYSRSTAVARVENLTPVG